MAPFYPPKPSLNLKYSLEEGHLSLWSQDGGPGEGVAIEPLPTGSHVFKIERRSCKPFQRSDEGRIPKPFVESQGAMVFSFDPAFKARN